MKHFAWKYSLSDRFTVITEERRYLLLELPFVLIRASPVAIKCFFFFLSNWPSASSMIL